MSYIFIFHKNIIFIFHENIYYSTIFYENNDIFIFQNFKLC